MNNRFSIETSIKQLFFLQIILSCLIIIPFVLTVSNFTFNNNLDDVRRKTFRDLNDYIIAINQNPTVIKDVTENYINLKKSLRNYSEYINTELSLTEPAYQNINEKDVYKKEISKLASEINNSANNARNSKYLPLIIIASIALFTAAGIIIFIFILNYKFSCFTKNTVRGLKHIDDLLNFHDTDETQETGCNFNYTEIDSFSSILHKISENIKRDRNIQDIDIHGNLEDFLSFIHSQISSLIKCDRIALAFIDKHNNVTAETAYTSYKQIFLQPGFSEKISATSLTKLKTNHKPRIINNLPEYSEKNSVSESTKNILQEEIKSSLTVPLYFQNRCIGFIFISSREYDAYSQKDAEFAERIAGVLRQKFYIEYLFQEIIAETSNSFITLMHEKDNETSLHIIRMTEYSYLIARTYYNMYKNITPRFIREIKWFAALHDIGKVGIPDKILFKNGALDASEFSLMKTHVNTGIKVIENMNERIGNILSRPVLSTAIDIISGHHEKYNGTGYPKGLKGNDIPLAGRIVSVADVFDALTSARPYKSAFSIEKALQIMEFEMPGHFDPEVFSCFKEVLPEIRSVYDKYKEI